jgi:uncharacterized protein involved in type VI secretion and phage assembly
MNLYEAIGNDSRPGSSGRIQGVVIGVVTSIKDPDNLGRVKLKFPWLSDQDESWWARIAVPTAGNGCGFYFLPAIDDEVLVAFEHGDMNSPFVLGALWNGKDKPPAAGNENVRVLTSRSGHTITMDDKDGEEKIEIYDKTKKNRIVFDTKANTIKITTDKDLSLSATNGTIKLSAQKIEIASTAETQITAGSNMDVKATGQMNVKGATVNIN